jgi:hypothetical protein
MVFVIWKRCGRRRLWPNLRYYISIFLSNLGKPRTISIGIVSLWYFGLAIAQGRCHWLPSAATRVEYQVRSCGIFGEQSGPESRFLKVIRFLLPILIPSTASHSLIILSLTLHTRSIDTDTAVNNQLKEVKRFEPGTLQIRSKNANHSLSQCGPHAVRCACCTTWTTINMTIF